jgi:hypothetical protein
MRMRPFPDGELFLPSFAVLRSIVRTGSTAILCVVHHAADEKTCKAVFGSAVPLTLTIHERLKYGQHTPPAWLAWLPPAGPNRVLVALCAVPAAVAMPLHPCVVR